MNPLISGQYFSGNRGFPKDKTVQFRLSFKEDSEICRWPWASFGGRSGALEGLRECQAGRNHFTWHNINIEVNAPNWGVEAYWDDKNEWGEICP